MAVPQYLSYAPRTDAIIFSMHIAYFERFASDYRFFVVAQTPCRILEKLAQLLIT